MRDAVFTKLSSQCILHNLDEMGSKVYVMLL